MEDYYFIFLFFFYLQDVDMHYEPTDTAAMARTSNLNEELGQVEKKLLVLTLCVEITHRIIE